MICRYDQVIPQVALRIDDPAVEEELKRSGVELAPGALLSSSRIVIGGDVFASKPLFWTGAYSSRTKRRSWWQRLSARVRRLLGLLRRTRWKDSGYRRAQSDR